MVHIYQQAEESHIKRLENILNLGEVCFIGIRNDNNYVMVRESLEKPSRNYRVSEDIPIVEDDSGPVHLYYETEIRQRCEEGEDIVIGNLENDLGLRGIYVFGIDGIGNVVIVHRGLKTKRVYVELFGYGATIYVVRFIDSFSGTIKELNICV